MTLPGYRRAVRVLVYASRARRPFGDPELLELLVAARAHNERRGVSGMLVYAAGSFLQQVEGEPGDVEGVWQRIRLDARHHDLRVLADETADRTFEDWSMGFAHPDHDRLEQTLPGYRASLQYPFVDRDPAGAQRRPWGRPCWAASHFRGCGTVTLRHVRGLCDLQR